MLPNRLECAFFGVCILDIILMVTGVKTNWTLVGLFLLLFIIPTGWGTAVGAGLANLSKKDYIAKVAHDKKNGTAEWYLVGPLAKYWQLALLYRGFQWGFLPAIALYFFIGLKPAIVLTVAFALAMLLSVVIAPRLPDSIKTKLHRLNYAITVGEWGSDWTNAEFLRGWIAGSIVFLALL